MECGVKRMWDQGHVMCNVGCGMFGRSRLRRLAQGLADYVVCVFVYLKAQAPLPPAPKKKHGDRILEQKGIQIVPSGLPFWCLGVSVDPLRDILEVLGTLG